MILPVLDTEKLQQKANEYAMQGAIKTIEEYYSGYNSPFRKIIEEELKKTQLGHGSIELPNILALINDSLSKEIDAIANTAIAKSFVPMVSKFLTRENSEIKFSEILTELIEITDSKNTDDCQIEVKKDAGYDWLKVTFYHGDKEYEMTFHTDYNSREEQIKKYQILSLPYDHSNHKQTMKLSIDNSTLELPFTSDILKDGVVSYIARLIIANSKITMDRTDFDDDMFPQDDCHCN